MRALVLVIALAGLVLVGVASAALARPPARDLRGDVTRADLRGVNFVESCRFSHQAPDDPIVFPGEPGASHQHTFVGNRTTDAFSTFGSLRSARTKLRPSGRHRGVLGARAVPGRLDRAPARGDDLLPARHGLPGHDVPERAADDRRRRGRDEPAGHARNVLELRAALGRPTVQRRADLSAGTRVVPPAARPLPAAGTGGGSTARTTRATWRTPCGGACPASHPVAVPAIAQIYRYPALGGEVHARLGRRVQRARGLLQRVEAGSAEAARRGLSERPRPLRARVRSPVPHRGGAGLAARRLPLTRRGLSERVRAHGLRDEPARTAMHRGGDRSGGSGRRRCGHGAREQRVRRPSGVGARVHRPPAGGVARSPSSSAGISRSGARHRGKWARRH